MNEEKTYDIAIVGGGLAGLTLAREIHHLSSSSSSSRSLDFILLEARSELGGRIATDTCGQKIDLGASWVWTSHQPLISQLITDLRITTFPQSDEPSSSRLVGGMTTLVQRMADELPSNAIRCQFPIASCRMSQNRYEEPCVMLESSKSGCDERIVARRVAFAVPPKILFKNVSFHPPLSPEKQRSMSVSTTWMAGVTKIALKYHKRFWANVTKDVVDENASSAAAAMSADGESLTYRSFYYGPPDRPAFQVYDSSSDDGFASLSFFTLVTSGPAARDDATLARQCANQLSDYWMGLGLYDMAQDVKCFNSFYVKRWSFETYISDDPYPSRVEPHPLPDVNLCKSDWAGLLLFAGSECDLEFPGLLEGAVRSAHRALSELKETFLINNR